LDIDSAPAGSLTPSVKEVHKHAENHTTAAGHDEGGRWVIESGQKQIEGEKAHTK
jgi:hypothetical protein